MMFDQAIFPCKLSFTFLTCIFHPHVYIIFMKIKGTLLSCLKVTLFAQIYSSSCITGLFFSAVCWSALIIADTLHTGWSVQVRYPSLYSPPICTLV